MIFMKNDDSGIPEWLVESREVSRGLPGARGERSIRFGEANERSAASDTRTPVAASYSNAECQNSNPSLDFSLYLHLGHPFSTATPEAVASSANGCVTLGCHRMT